MSIVEVARAAGVSTSTVSRVINANPAVRPEIARRVKASMRELGYVPPVVRRGPKTARAARKTATYRIGFVLLGRTRELLEFPSMARFLSGATEAVHAAKSKIEIIEVPDLTRPSPSLRGGGVDGLIVTGQQVTPALVDCFHPMPVVWQGGVAPELPIADHVLVSNAAIGTLAARYLLEGGCRDVAYLNHDPDHVSFRPRFEVFRACAGAAGAAVRVYESPVRPVPEPDMWTGERLRTDFSELVGRMLADTAAPQGVYVPTDQQAAFLHAALIVRGIRPGSDLRIISCNNDAAWLAPLHPRPATIDPRPDEQGRLAVRRLLERLENPGDNPVVISVTPRLVEGE